MVSCFEIARRILEMMALIFGFIDRVDEQPALGIGFRLPLGEFLAVGRWQGSFKPDLCDSRDGHIEGALALGPKGVTLASKLTGLAASRLGENDDPPLLAQMGPIALEPQFIVAKPAERAILILGCGPKTSAKIYESPCHPL